MNARMLPGLIAVVTLAAPCWAQPTESAVDQQEALWKLVSAEPYEELPKVQGVNLFAPREDLERSFDQDRDARPDRRKQFHHSGTVAKVVFVPAAQVQRETQTGMAPRLEATGEQTRSEQVTAEPHPYTGLFLSGGPGLVRLSLADKRGRYIPGVAIKLFVPGKTSRNILAIPGFETQRSADFFEKSPTNILQPPGFFNIGAKILVEIQKNVVPVPLRLSVDSVAEVDCHGRTVESPRAPHKVIFKPAEAHTPARSKEDFRKLVAEQVPVGTVIYKVYGQDEGSSTEHYLGDIKTESEFVASEYGDRRLHFVHKEWRERGTK